MNCYVCLCTGAEPSNGVPLCGGCFKLMQLPADQVAAAVLAAAAEMPEAPPPPPSDELRPGSHWICVVGIDDMHPGDVVLLDTTGAGIVRVTDHNGRRGHVLHVMELRRCFRPWAPHSV